MSLPAALDRFFASTTAPIAPGDSLVVAFSGGPDSTALASALAVWAPSRGVSLRAAHLDHGLDPDSHHRARAAAAIAERLGLPLVGERRPVPELRRPGESPEEAARRLRYDFLEQVRRRFGARYVATAHHLDDQAETVVLRLLQGSGLAGLGAIEPRRQAVVRPLLDRPRRELAAWLAARRLTAVDDPTNRDPRRPRNRVRQAVLPALATGEAELPAVLARLATTAQRSHRTLERRLDELLAPRGRPGRVEIDRRRLEQLPAELRPAALALLRRRAGATYPATAAALRELDRQLSARGRIGCDTGGGWRLAGATRLRLARPAPRARAFAYTLDLPGEIVLPETAGAFRLRRQQVEPWMFAPSRWRAGLSLPLAPGDRVTVRNRRPGDRMRPFGCAHERRLKDILIDRKVPREERDRLPLLCLGRRVLWVPGVGIDETCRLDGAKYAWAAEFARS